MNDQSVNRSQNAKNLAQKMSFLDRVISASLRHRLVVVFAAVVLLIYGGWVGSKLSIDVFPDLNRPVVTVMTEANGMAPEEVETLVTLPLETQLNGLSGVERVRSVSGVGLSIVYVEFVWGAPVLQNRQLVAERLALAAERLPRGVVPVMAPIASIMGEVQLLGLYSKDSASSQDLRTFADWVLRPRLLSVPGISQVVVIGGGVKQYQILISAEKLQRYQLTLEDLEVNLKSLGRNTTGGYLDQGGREFLIRNIGSVRSEEDIKQSVVGMLFGRPVRVADVAHVQVGTQVKRGDASVNGHPAVVLSVQKQPGANTLEIEKEIDAVLDQIQTTLPAGSTLERSLFKQSVFIRSAIHNVTEALRDGAILVAIVLFVFLLNVRTTVITLIAIPLSFVLTAIVFKLFNFGINTMTLGGLAIAIGELVDDAIVDVENVFRRLKQNQSRPVAEQQSVVRVVYEASSEVRNSIVYATAIVVLVFLPLFFLGGIEGRFFIPLGVAYVVSLVASLVVSLTVTPVLCSFWLKNTGFGGLKNHQDSPLVTRLKHMHRRGLEWALMRPRVVMIFALGLLGVSVILLSTMGREFLPKFNESSATITVLAQPGISLNESNVIGRRAEEIILKTPEVALVSRRTGRAELDEHAEGVHYSEVDVAFKDPESVKPVRPREVVLEEIRNNLNVIENVYINIGQPISHRLDHLLSGVRAQIAIKVFGPDLKQLRQTATAIYKAIQGTVGLVDLQVEQQVLIPQIKIQLLRDSAAQFGLSNGRLNESLETAFKGQNITQIIDHQRLFNVFMRLDDVSRSDQETFKKTPVRIMPDGSKVMLGAVADVYESSGPNAIMRENVQRRIVVQANVLNRDLESVVKELQAKVANQVKLNDGYYLDWAGQFKSQEQGTKTILLLSLLSLVSIFIILYINFKSAFIAVQIMLNIPMALIGSVVAVYLVDRTVSMATLVAFVTLCGIASRNGIMLISHYLHLMQYEGEQFTKNMVIRGSLERLVPVMMTVLTAILGLTPLLFAAGQPGKEILHPLAVVIVGGLISSTLLDLIVTPTVFYNYGRASALQSIEQKETMDL
jgi:CzcA family heavy metal efflux pump